MISRRTSRVPKEDVFSRLLYCDSRCSQTCCWRSLACRRRSQVHPGLSSALPGLLPALPDAPMCTKSPHRRSDVFPNLSQSLPWYFCTSHQRSSYSEGRQECPPRVRDSPEIDASKFALHTLSDTPGGFKWLKYILLMDTLRLMYGKTTQLQITVNLAPMKRSEIMCAVVCRDC